MLFQGGAALGSLQGSQTQTPWCMGPGGMVPDCPGPQECSFTSLHRGLGLRGWSPGRCAPHGRLAPGPTPFCLSAVSCRSLPRPMTHARLLPLGPAGPGLYLVSCILPSHLEQGRIHQGTPVPPGILNRRPRTLTEMYSATRHLSFRKELAGSHGGLEIGVMHGCPHPRAANGQVSKNATCPLGPSARLHRDTSSQISAEGLPSTRAMCLCCFLCIMAPAASDPNLSPGCHLLFSP